MSLVSLSNLFSPRTISDLPWCDESKQSLEFLVYEMAQNVEQPLFVLTGAKGSGKSLLLRRILPRMYFEQLDVTQQLSFDAFKKKSTLCFSPFSADPETSKSFVQSWTVSHSVINGRKLVLLDDLDLFPAADWKWLQQLIVQKGVTLRVVFVATCLSSSGFENGVLGRLARRFELPFPKWTMSVNLYFRRVCEEVLLLESESWLEESWRVGGCCYSGMFEQLDKRLLNSGVCQEMDFSEKECFQLLVDSIAAKEGLDQLVKRARGFSSLRDVLIVVWDSMKSRPEEFDDKVISFLCLISSELG